MKSFLHCVSFSGIVFVALLTLPAPAFADATPTATITIRDGAHTAFTGIVELAASTTPQVGILATNSTAAVSVSADSLLATLVALDATMTDFDITNLSYSADFNAFLINCIAVPSGVTSDCFNWTDAINGIYPQVGVDHQILQDGDIVYLFFGPSHQTMLSKNTVTVGESFTATAQQYDLPTGTYLPLSGVTLGVGTPNPDFSFTELATSTVDSNGNAVFAISAAGAYSVGIKEDFYFPTTALTVTDVPVAAQNPSASSGSGPGDSGSGVSHPQLNVPNALAYLARKQKSDGSFDASYLSDWAAIALASTDSGAAKSKLHDYLLTATPALSSVTDYERHAMALEALGINPYSGTPSDYIKAITRAFDGTQVGDVHLDNDDIFALFPLLAAGYSASDDIIRNTVAFILSAQNANGSWDSSVDMTAAAIQALAQVRSLTGVPSALTRAETYLRSQEGSNGGFGNSFSTSWALQAIAAIGESQNSWAQGSFTPQDYLASLQQSDGGLEPETADGLTRVWATEYAIPATLGKAWPMLLQQFAKPTTNAGADGSTHSSEASLEATSTIPTFPDVGATSTPPVASSTPPVLQATTTVPAVAVTRMHATSTIILPPHKKAKVKIASALKTLAQTQTSANPPIPVPAESQTAAVATVSSGNFFSHLWNSLDAFVCNML